MIHFAANRPPSARRGRNFGIEGPFTDQMLQTRAIDPRAHARFKALGALLALACLALATSAMFATASQASNWRIKGGGFGHGVGMSQYGAYGYAKHGLGYKAILTHYFQKTRVAATGPKKVRVLLAPMRSSVSFKGATKACGKKLSAGSRYRGVRGPGTKVILRNPAGHKIGACGVLLHATGGKSVVLSGKGKYRGALEVRASSSAGLVNAINAVGIDDYARGVVAGEMPASWSMDALRAQAVAARSYGLSTDVGGKGFEQYDDTRSQVYGGVAAEHARSSKAVSSTSKQVVKYGKKIVTTFYSSSSGGHTESIQNSFIGSSPQPFLKGVVDKYDSISPLHRWTYRRSGASMQSTLGGYVKGSLKKIVVKKRGVSPRIVRAVVVGSGGKKRITGPTLKALFGLPDTPWSLKKI